MEHNLPLTHIIGGLLSPGQTACVVGGTVRDLLLGRKTGDVDLAVSGDAGGLAERVAGKVGGSAFCMDAGRDVFRVACKDGFQVDIAPLAGSIEENLARRDFTINAMALPIKTVIARSASAAAISILIDPFGGMDDLGARLVRALGESVFEDDPLRLLRAFRLAGQLGFEVEGSTLTLIGRDAHLIRGVSAERVRDELYAILEMDGAAAVLSGMSESGLLCEALPETAPMAGLAQGEPHVHDLLTHSLKTMEYSESVMVDLGGYFGARAAEVLDYLQTPVDGGLTMRGLVKLCALLHDVGKPACMKAEEGRVSFIGHDLGGAAINEAIAVRLKLSTRAGQALSAVTAGHMRPLHLSFGVPTRRAVYRYVRDMGDALPASLIVALADAIATRDRPDSPTTDVEGLVMSTAEYYYGEYGRAKEKPLLRGGDLIELFGLEPGPVFRRILEAVEEKRAEGALSSREEAIKYVKENMGRYG